MIDDIVRTLVMLTGLGLILDTVARFILRD
jgi:hypothetical protein